MTAPPRVWPAKRLRFVARTRTAAASRDPLDGAREVTFLPMEAIGEQGELDLSASRSVEEVQSGYSRFRDGDVVMAKITPCFENGKGALIRGTATGVGYGTTELHVLTPGPELDGRFLYYLTVEAEFRRLGEAYMAGSAGQQRVPEDFVRDYQIPVPPLPHQRAVANYLDHETARIDNLIAAKQRTLRLLAEKRWALVRPYGHRRSRLRLTPSRLRYALVAGDSGALGNMEAGASRQSRKRVYPESWPRAILVRRHDPLAQQCGRQSS